MNNLFISHASPEDNPFVIWLSARLQSMGYTVWCDIEQFKGGERDYWGRLEGIIRDQSCKFLIVISRNSMMSDGVLKEFHFAEQVAKEKGIHDFVLPLWIEKVPYTIRIGLSIYNKINFENNWADGLRQLIEKLQTDSVARSDNFNNETFLNTIRRPLKHDVVNGLEEEYYTNWWPINSLPEKLYCFHYDNETQAKAIMKEVRIFPVHRHGNILISFQSTLPTKITTTNESESQLLPDEIVEDIVPKEIIEIEISAVLSKSIQSLSFPTQLDAENLLKRILWKGFFLLLRRRGLLIHEMSNKTACFYYPIGVVYKNKAIIKYPKVTRLKNLLGKFGESTWHFGVTCKITLHPLLCFNLKSHIVFSDDGTKIWSDSGKLHSARRKKGKSWFNEHWRDQLMVFLSALRHSKDDEIVIQLNEEFNLVMPLLTKNYNTSFGYREPKTNDRQNLINEDDEIEETIEVNDTTDAKE